MVQITEHRIAAIENVLSAARQWRHYLHLLRDPATAADGHEQIIRECKVSAHSLDIAVGALNEIEREEKRIDNHA